ncbi:NmrA/HSCARG family protein [Dactylosporangium sp. NPDC050688]|uniref:NmrA/HSCARG family protein n=1 Tax=Dactylosporangium sp. NPDC050688 TaxID=3157217 RepID=UPI0033FBFF58
MPERTIVVTGATGLQGGATARQLLASGEGWHVRALVRDQGTPAARALVEAGAELVTGDMGDRASLDAAFAGAHGVFSVQPAYDAPHFEIDEVRLGVNVADAAHAAGVRHLVYTSVGGVERGSGITHWDTKWQIEQHIRALGVPATFLRPVMFMENHASAKYGVTSPTALIRMIAPGARVQLIAVDDIGAFAALAFADPATYLSLALELAGDEVTREELASSITRATGIEIPAAPVPAEVLAGQGIDIDNVQRAGSFGGWQADIHALRRLHPGLMDLRTWLTRVGAGLFARLVVPATPGTAS